MSFCCLHFEERSQGTWSLWICPVIQLTFSNTCLLARESLRLASGLSLSGYSSLKTALGPIPGLSVHCALTRIHSLSSQWYYSSRHHGGRRWSETGSGGHRQLAAGLRPSSGLQRLLTVSQCCPLTDETEGSAGNYIAWTS